MLEVQVSGSLRTAVSGAASIKVEAATIRELMNYLIAHYPAMQSRIDEGVAVSINGNIFRDNWSETIPEDAEVFLMPRLAGG